MEEEQEINIANFDQAIREAGVKVLGLQDKENEGMDEAGHLDKDFRKERDQTKINATRSQRLKDRLKSRYAELNREVKRMAKADKKSFMEGLTKEAEEAARKQDLKTLYRITKTLSDGLKNTDVPVKDTNGNLVSSKTGKLGCWKEHFQTILNRPEPTETAQIRAAEEDVDVNTDQPTLEEVKMAIKVMRNGKAPGSDGVTAEMLKVEDTVTPRLLTQIFSDIWETESIPEDWKMGLIVKLPKKKETCPTATTGEVSPFYHSQAKSLPKLFKKD